MLETCAEPLTASGLDIVHRPPGNTDPISIFSSKVLTDTFSLQVIGEYVRQQGQGSAAVFHSSIQQQPGNPWTDPSQSP